MCEIRSKNFTFHSSVPLSKKHSPEFGSEFVSSFTAHGFDLSLTKDLLIRLAAGSEGGLRFEEEAVEGLVAAADPL